MSRYQALLPNGRILAWGFDRMEPEYFVQEFYTKKESLEINLSNAEYETADYEGHLNHDYQWKDPEVLFHIGNHTVVVPHPKYPDYRGFGNSDIIEILQGYHITDPVKKTLLQGHIEQLKLDLPF